MCALKKNLIYLEPTINCRQMLSRRMTQNVATTKVNGCIVKLVISFEILWIVGGYIALGSQIKNILIFLVHLYRVCAIWVFNILIVTLGTRYNTENIPEVRSTVTMLISHKNELLDWARFSSFTKLLGTVTYWLRFVEKCKRIHTNCEAMSTEELEEAHEKKHERST